MAAWHELEHDAADLAARIRARFEQGRDHVLATLRRDGSPRVSGTEVEFLDGEVQFGMMPDSQKLADVRRDPRVAVHAATLVRRGEQGGLPGDAKLAGRALEYVGRVDPQHPGAGQFHLDITEAVLTSVDEERQLLVIESWHEGRGYRRRERA